MVGDKNQCTHSAGDGIRQSDWLRTVSDGPQGRVSYHGQIQAASSDFAILQIVLSGRQQDL